jgi:proteasome assembly chaperone 2
MDTTNRSDSQMQSVHVLFYNEAPPPNHYPSTPTYTFIPPASPPLPPPQFEALSALEPYKVEEKISEFAQKPVDTTVVPPIPGGGLARRIFASLNDPRDGGAAKSWSVPMIGILHYVFEGDNRGDAGMLLAIVNRAIELKIQGMCGWLFPRVNFRN